MRSLLQLALWCAAVSLLACATAPRSLPAAESSLADNDLDVAERSFRDATRQYLTESERERVRDGLVRIAEKRAEPRLLAAQSKPGFAGLVALAEARKVLHQQGAGRTEDGKPTLADERLKTAIEARIESLWPVVTAQAKAQRYGSALAEADRLLAPLGSKLPEKFSAPLQALMLEAQAFHRARLAASKHPGAQALHAGLVRRFGGEAESPIDALRAATWVQLTVRSGTAGACGGAAAAVANVSTSGPRKASVQVLMSTCVSNSQVSQSSNTYAWIEKVPYQTTERVQTGTQQVVDSRRSCSRNDVQYSNGRQVPVTVTYDCSTYKSVPVYSERVVTKYKDVERTGTRLERTEKNTLHYEGVARVTWPEGTADVPLSIQLSAADTAWSSPHGSKGIDFNKSLKGLEQAAVSELKSRLVGGASRVVNASAAARAEAEAAQALARGDIAAAEDADVRAIVAVDAVSQATVARIGARYGLDGPGLKEALDGKAPAPSTASLALNSNDTLTLGNSSHADQNKGEAILERGFTSARMEMGLRGFTSHDLPGQPDRAGVGALIRLAYPLIGNWFGGEVFDSRGWVLYDTLMFDFSLGARTTDAVKYQDDKEEGGVAISGGIGYQLMAGYRGGKLGLFGGIRAQRFARMAGDYRTGGASYPLAGRMELRVWDRNPIFAEFYGLKALGDNEVRGLDVLFTLNGVHGMNLRYELTDMDARYNGKHFQDVIDLGRQATSTFDVSYVLQF